MFTARLRLQLAAILGLVAVFGVTLPAAADETATEATAIEAAVTRVAPTASTAEVVTLQNGDVASEGLTADVLATSSGRGLVTVTGASGIPVSIGLPREVDDAVAEVTDAGSIVYQDPEGMADVVVQPLEDGVRIQTVINSDLAAESYEYPLAPGVDPVINVDGSVDLLLAAEGISVGVGHLDSPWAFDAQGNAVATRFVVIDGTLAQIVDHRVPGTAYPVVADPMYQGDCGIVTCTARFDRAATKNIRDGASLGAIGAALATLKWGGWVAPVITAFLGTQAVLAGRYYGNENCYGMKRLIVGALFTATEVKAGKYNCA